MKNQPVSINWERRKRLLYLIPVLVIIAIIIYLFRSGDRVTVGLDIPGGGVLEDALLIVSNEGEAPRNVFILGDIDLTESSLHFDFETENDNTHWWIIGSMGGQVAYTSNSALGRESLYSIEPYMGSTPLDWNIPANLSAYAEGESSSLDWWAQTINNHSSHTASKGADANLWLFSPEGSSLGTIRVSY